MVWLSLVALASLMQYAVGRISPEPRNLIIGGTEASEGRYSYAVSIKDDFSGHFCGGSLISKSVVLTAAHCVAFGDVNVTVTIGRHNLTDTTVGEEIMIAESVLHPNYDMRFSEDFDIALVFLAQPVSVDVDIVHINANGSIPMVGTGVTYLGWGEMDSDDVTMNVSETLREVDSTVISNEQCNTIAGMIDGTDRMDSMEGLISDVEMCTFAIGKDSCQKDSGGPVIMKSIDTSEDVQVGVASWGIKCASNVFPGVAARTSTDYDWIRDTICNQEGIEPAPEFRCSGNETIAEVHDMLGEMYLPQASEPVELSDNNNETLAEIEAIPAISANASDSNKETMTEIDTDVPAPTNGGDSYSQNVIEIEISDQTNEGDFEGDATHSFASLTQQNSATVCPLVLALVIINL